MRVAAVAMQAKNDDKIGYSSGPNIIDHWFGRVIFSNLDLENQASQRGKCPTGQASQHRNCLQVDKIKMLH